MLLNNNKIVKMKSMRIINAIKGKTPEKCIFTATWNKGSKALGAI